MSGEPNGNVVQRFSENSQKGPTNYKKLGKPFIIQNMQPKTNVIYMLPKKKKKNFPEKPIKFAGTFP